MISGLRGTNRTTEECPHRELVREDSKELCCGLVVTVSGSEGSLQAGHGEAEHGRFLTFEYKSEEETSGSSRC